MANWDSYTQKATPEDNDTLMLKDTAAGANKRTPFSGVWNWIVNKMTNAVISNLETSNKMIIPAINELNSKSIFRSYTKDLDTEANGLYQEMATISLTGNNLIVASSSWLTGQPLGLKITSSNESLTYAISENDNGYQTVIFVASDISVKVFEKIKFANNTGRARVVVATFKVNF